MRQRAGGFWYLPDSLTLVGQYKDTKKGLIRPKTLGAVLLRGSTGSCLFSEGVTSWSERLSCQGDWQCSWWDPQRHWGRRWPVTGEGEKVGKAEGRARGGSPRTRLGRLVMSASG